MPTYWIAAIVVFFVYLLPMFYIVRYAVDDISRFDSENLYDMVMATLASVLFSLALGLFWPLTLVGTVLFFVVRWLEGVRVK